ncbi:MAG: hypothetical protein ABI852_00830 [Gemmatimonadaceae bacterium]
MLLRQVGLVSVTPHVSLAMLSLVSAALQRQVVRDFAPIWGVSATVDVFATVAEMPIGYWPIIIADAINSANPGVHEDGNGQPFALVRYDANWVLTTSHECLEMLADPSGYRLTTARSLLPEQGRVNYLVEVCDPCEAAGFGYTVNGFTVSDFYTPQYFEPQQAPGVRYSFTGSITEPRQVLPGGYLSWVVPSTNEWFQCKYFHGAPVIASIGFLKRDNQSLRATIDRLTGNHIMSKHNATAAHPELAAALRNDAYISSDTELDRAVKQPVSTPLLAAIEEACTVKRTN